VYNTEGPYLAGGKPELIPPGLQSGCVASNGSVEVIEVDPADGWVSLNFVMAATFMLVTASIDHHDMWIYEIDGHYVMPRRIQGVIMYPGERYSVLVKLDKAPGDYILRVPATLSQVMSAFAVIRYKGSKPATTLQPGVIPPSTTGYIDYGGFNTSANVTILDGGYDHVPPFPPYPPAAHANAMHVVSMGRWQAPWRWTFTGKAVMPVDAGAYDPILYAPNSPLALDTNLTIRTLHNSWVDVVLRVGALPGEPAEISHAIHKHGSKVWLIGQGDGIWNYPSVEAAMAAEPGNFNLVDPNYRDTVITTFRGAAWFVIRYQATNPGPWLLHCHVETHLAGGMGMVIMDGVDNWPVVPSEYALGRSGYGS
jgi:FtsP/CotA-like multicopper oxidase with cupredoxin domain